MLCGDLPREVHVGKKRYSLDLSYDTVLFACSEQTGLLDGHKTELALRMLVRGRLPRGREKRERLREAIFALLSGDDATPRSQQKVFDIDQDAEAIRASFLQAYGLNLDAQRGKLHYLRFITLLSSLPDDTIMSHIIDIRSRPMPRPTKDNAKERAQLARLKQTYRLKHTGSQLDTLSAGINRLFDALKAKAGE